MGNIADLDNLWITLYAVIIFISFFLLFRHKIHIFLTNIIYLIYLTTKAI
jgi:hypothetical protein